MESKVAEVVPHHVLKTVEREVRGPSPSSSLLPASLAASPISLVCDISYAGGSSAQPANENQVKDVPQTGNYGKALSVPVLPLKLRMKKTRYEVSVESLSSSFGSAGTSVSSGVSLPLLQQQVPQSTPPDPALTAVGVPVLRPTALTDNSNRKCDSVLPLKIRMKKRFAPFESCPPIRLAGAIQSMPMTWPFQSPVLHSPALPYQSPPLQTPACDSGPPLLLGETQMAANGCLGSWGRVSVVHSESINTFNSLNMNEIKLDRRPCKCAGPSMCLKRYCSCFARGDTCNLCNCKGCYNNMNHKDERLKAINHYIEEKKAMLQPKILTTPEGTKRLLLGCHCKVSACIKKFCICFKENVPCSKNCRCKHCQNKGNHSGKRQRGQEKK